MNAAIVCCHETVSYQAKPLVSPSMRIEKEYGWAYPSSETAKTLGCSTTGTWFARSVTNYTIADSKEAAREMCLAMPGELPSWWPAN